MANIVGRLQSFFPSHQIDVIIGSLLGDARLECRSVGLRNPITARFTLSTHSFQEFEQYLIVKFLKEKYDVFATVIKDRAKQKIHIGKNDYEKFKAVIEPYIIPSMIYKIVSPRNDLIDKTIGMQG